MFLLSIQLSWLFRVINLGDFTTQGTDMIRKDDDFNIWQNFGLTESAWFYKRGTFCMFKQVCSDWLKAIRSIRNLVNPGPTESYGSQLSFPHWNREVAWQIVSCIRFNFWQQALTFAAARAMPWTCHQSVSHFWGHFFETKLKWFCTFRFDTFCTQRMECYHA